MTVIIWITEGTWQATVDAARVHAPADADLVLLHVTSGDVSEMVRGSFAGLLGRAIESIHMETSVSTLFN